MILQTKIIIVLVLVISVLGYFSYSEVIRHGETKQELRVSQDTIDTLQSSILELEESRQAIEDKVSKVSSEAAEARRNLRNLRDRESIVVAKPGLVEIKINKSFNNTQERLACITGDSKLCEK